MRQPSAKPGHGRASAPPAGCRTSPIRNHGRDGRCCTPFSTSIHRRRSAAAHSPVPRPRHDREQPASSQLRAGRHVAFIPESMSWFGGVHGRTPGSLLWHRAWPDQPCLANARTNSRLAIHEMPAGWWDKAMFRKRAATVCRGFSRDPDHGGQRIVQACSKTPMIR